jgi:hypothetical protein
VNDGASALRSAWRDDLHRAAEVVAGMVDLALVVPGTETARIQEGHLILIHLIAEQIDVAFARDSVLWEP